MSGTYVALEGIEGAGKSTVRRLLAERLRGHGLEVTEVREPGGTPAGEQIRAILLDPDGRVDPWTEALLFAAARSQLASEVIAPALARGAMVISDRSVYSSLAYQGAGRGLGIEEVRAVNEAGLGRMWPELVVLLRVDHRAGLDRQQVEDRIGAEHDPFHEAVATAYDALAAAEEERFVVVDASLPLGDVVALVEEAIEGAW